MNLTQVYLSIILISSITAAASAPVYAKHGCQDTCGHIRIPYPFGIGSDCALNKWYAVECKFPTPYLPALNNLEVLKVDLENQTVTVNMSTVSNCQNRVSQFSSMDLGESPFLFSKENKFMAFGCDYAGSISENGKILSGCSTICHGNGTDVNLQENSCFGINCCQTMITYYLKSYTIDVLGLERKGVNDDCWTAFLVDQVFYSSSEVRLSRQSHVVGDYSFVPVTLRWILAYEQPDFDCQYYTVERLDLSNGALVESYGCRCYQGEGNPYLSYGCQVNESKVPTYVKRGCQQMCGNIQIPYPFGIGPNCSANKWYAIDCNSLMPYLRAVNNLQVLNISLENQTVAVNISTSSECQNNSQFLSMDLADSPFLFSSTHNKFMVEGCGNAVILEHGKVLTGCSSICFNGTVNQQLNSCSGINCCQTMISYYLTSYTIDVSALERVDINGACGSAFLVDENFYSSSKKNSFIPVALRWTITNQDVNTCYGRYRRELLELANGSSILSPICSCGFCEDGTPYLPDGCQLSEECKKCKVTGGHCSGIENMTCFRNNVPEGKAIGVILGVSISMGILLLTASIFALYRVVKVTKDKRRKKRFFKRNGGLLLRQQEAADEGLVDKTRLFTSNELEKATDYFHENRVLGRGGQGTVYKGMLTDGRIVAVKKSKVVDERQLEQFINEVVVLSQVNHRNVVKLLGCCLETEVPLLVSEFISNGTLYEHIHDENDELPLSWNMRLRIATEVAGALAYLHYATSIPIYHRDIKSTNILLDDKLRAKVSDFGTSRFITIDQTHLTTLVKGTFGYLDPEYFQSSQFTEKSDVYSFGVVLVELLTGEKPISLTRFGEHRNLATYFLSAMVEGQEVTSLIDAKLLNEGSRTELMAVANLAIRCLNSNGKNRPTMKEVATELEATRMSHVPSMVPTSFDFEHATWDAGEELPMLSYGESTSTRDNI